MPPPLYLLEQYGLEVLRRSTSECSDEVASDRKGKKVEVVAPALFLQHPVSHALHVTIQRLSFFLVIKGLYY